MSSRQSILCLSPFSCIVFLFFGLAIFLTATPVFASYGGNETDHQALLSFKSMIDHDPYGALSSWNTSLHVCKWNGVLCGKRHKRVTALHMESQGLKGSLSPYVGNLSFLRGLSLWNNSFYGTIPNKVGRLSRLQYLYLDQNKFKGVIPTTLSGCSKLEELLFGENKLVGSIPKEISFLSKLTYLSLQYNALSGGIPPFLGNITSLERLNVEKNPLGGRIPGTLGHLKSLGEFRFAGCDLYGTIPRSIYNLSLLTEFHVSNNQLSGSLPLDLGAAFPNLVILNLWDNQLTGLLPPSISNCTKLQLLQTISNNFNGKLTINFAKLKDVYQVAIGNGRYGHGAHNEMNFIDSLKNCTRLQRLVLRNCKFQGVLPKSIGNLSDQLSYLSLAENKLLGNLPSSIGNLVGLNTLDLGDNLFTGKIPFTIGKLQKLVSVKLYENQFSGSIPSTIGNLSFLDSIHLYSNRLEGHIPPSLGNCHHLTMLELYNNKLCGKIPEQLLQISSLSIGLDLSQNRLSGSLPTEVGDLKMLTSLDLSSNNLSGNIPSSLSGCTSLSVLYIDNNLFQGLIPPSLSSLRGIVAIDFSHNNLSGQIPRFLERFLIVQYIDLSFNDFEGEVPMLGVFTNASAFSVLGNSRLCGGLVELGLPKCNEIKEHKKRFPLFIIAILIASALIIVLCCAYAWCMKKRNVLPSESSLGDERFLKVSYNQLLKATDGFSKANLLGQGGFSSVYKGILNVDDDRFVAVKVLHLQNQGAQRSFMRECEAWRNIRHRNLLKIITSCSSIDFQGNDFKALVYEFMPNGSLHDLLHSATSTFRLNLLQRVNILMDVASAVDYLHNRCLTTIVHGDLKPSNILLDEDMVAHVGDFGLARFLGTNSNQNNSTGVKGTIGYAPPEYGMGNEMTSSGDVYSFGILVLEVISGKSPTDDIFTEDLSLHKFACMSLPDHVIDFIDGDAIVLQSTKENAKKMEECLASIVKVGVSCSVDSPLQRMNIENAVYELHHILDVLQNI
ncbi:kinase-like domain-containing protein [Tanacetum coccineum]